jgi:uncharacterized protein (DUF983 family)
MNVLFKRFSAILKQLCPRCLQGKVFGKLWKMNRRCPACGLEFEREPGYYLGAMYFSYGLAVVSGIPIITTFSLFARYVASLGSGCRSPLGWQSLS